MAVKVATIEVATRPILPLCFRIAAVIALGLGVWVLGMLVFCPESIWTIIQLTRLLISSGRGFAIPTVVLIVLLPRIIERVLDRGD